MYSHKDVFGCNFTFILQAAAVVVEALKDNHLSEIDQQTLSFRGTLLLHTRGLSKDLKQKLRGNLNEPLNDPPKITIKAKSLQG
jgi:hypothetical protein